MSEQSTSAAFDEPFVAAVVYHDVKRALDWLERAFGFELSMLIEGTDGDPRTSHAEMSLAGRGRIMISGEWADWTRSPSSVGGANTCFVHVHLQHDVDAHCARARAAGAEIMAEPSDQFYGDRTYRARDPEGHVWTFSQTVRKVSKAEAEAAIGEKIYAPTWA
jgi:uncharacterized glyoxalase superfamily protein PhnB